MAVAANCLRPLAGEQHSAPHGRDDAGSAVRPPTPAPASPPRPRTGRGAAQTGKAPQPCPAPAWSRSPERGRRRERRKRGGWGGEERGAVNKELPLCEVLRWVQNSRLPEGPRSVRQPTREPTGSGTRSRAPGPTCRADDLPLRNKEARAH